MANNNRNQSNQNWNRNQGQYDQENDYNQSNDYNQNRNRRGGYEKCGNWGGASYGNQYGGQNDSNQDQNYNRPMSNYGNLGNYGNDYSNYGSAGGWNSNREAEDRGWGNTPNYGGSDNSRNMGRNYGNMNQDRGNRDWWERTKDEVSSWFRDDDAERRRSGDRRIAGEHRGKGPKGYTRSDERIREDIHDRLSDDPYVDASDIEIKVEKCEVVLTGNVSDREQKRRAEDIVESVSGVRHVENRIRVNQEHHNYAATNQRRGNYTGTTNDAGGIGSESGTTNEIIRNTGNLNTNK